MITIQGIDPNMIANNIESAYPTHPGSILKDEIEYRGITQHKLAQQMGVPYSALNEILNGKRPLTEKMALLFEAILGIDAEPLLALHFSFWQIELHTHKVYHAVEVVRIDKARPAVGCYVPFRTLERAEGVFGCYDESVVGTILARKFDELTLVGVLCISCFFLLCFRVVVVVELVERPVRTAVSEELRASVKLVVAL